MAAKCIWKALWRHEGHTFEIRAMPYGSCAGAFQFISAEVFSHDQKIAEDVIHENPHFQIHA